jgi:hypothetical protein
MRSCVCVLWSVCGRFVDNTFNTVRFRHRVFIRGLRVVQSLGVYTPFATHEPRVGIHLARWSFASVVGGFSPLSPGLIISPSWYKKNISISSVCGKVFI